MKKKFTLPIILLGLILYGFLPYTALAQGNEEPIPCNYTDGSCISVGYVSIEFVEGSPDLYLISVDYQINQGGEENCPLIRRIRFNPTHQNSGIIEIGDEEEIIGSTILEVNANSFDSPGQDRILTLTVEYEDPGIPNLTIPIQAPEVFECGEITPLPVELTRFEGKATESGIELEWGTASELNNSHFEVERSTDGESFASIARQQGQGTTSTPATYNYTDKLPKNGINYYRLKQVDYDNTYSYTKTLAVKWDAGDAMQVAMVPNPCLNGDCKIALSNAANLETLIQLKDMAGRVVYSKTITSNSHLFELPLNELKQYKGLYFLSATTGRQVMHQRILLE